jgi:ATP-dependent DNA helicase RecQ
MVIPSHLHRQVNLREEATLILRLVIDTGATYGSNYLVRLLRGDDAFELHDPAHRTLEGFGCMPDQSSDRLHSVIRYLVREQLLRVADPVRGTLSLSQAGTDFLNAPFDLIASYQSLQYSPMERLLMHELRDIRRKLGNEEQKAPFLIFTDYVMQRLVEEKPETVEALRLIPGFGDYKVNRYGPALLQAVPRAREQHQEQLHLKLMRAVQNPAHQQTKSYFEAGHSEAEIAAKRMVKPATVRKHLISLHRAGEIDLSPWIEATLKESAFEQGVSYFRQAESGRLREAYETLGLDYDTLQLCRLYVAKVSSQHAVLKTA